MYKNHTKEYKKGKIDWNKQARKYFTFVTCIFMFVTEKNTLH